MSSNQQQVLRDRVVDGSRHTKDIATEQIRTAATIGKEAAVSGAYLYPVAGVYYLFRHPRLWKPLARPLFLTFLTSIAVTATLFFFTYLPQAAALTLFNGPFGFIAAVPLVLSESGTIVLFLARAFWLAPSLDNVFDQVLLDQGLTSLVANGRQIEGAGAGKRLGKSLMAPLNRFSKEGIIRYFLSLPLNFIPVVGTVFFLAYNGNKSGPGHHERFFQLKKLSPEQKQEFIAKRRGSYTAFGTASMAMNLIPGLSILFAFATAAGAALWAADLEKKSGAQVDTSVSGEATEAVSDIGKKAA